MEFNLNEFLKSIANTLDIVEIAILGIPTNHSKRLAYISAKIALELGLGNEEIFDLCSLALLHDNGATMVILDNELNMSVKEKLNIVERIKGHCTIGEANLKDFPFFTNPKDVIKYHHEKYDGSGFFGLKGDEIPFFAQIIAIADTIDLTFDIHDIDNRNDVIDFVKNNKKIFFSEKLSNTFLNIADNEDFWVALNDYNIDSSLDEVIPTYSNELTYREIHKITKIFSAIIDAKSKYTQLHSSGLTDKIEIMADYYNMDERTKFKLLIATDLHDIGKLAISNDILDKPGRLTSIEFEEIKRHSLITRLCLQNIKGFEEITEWAVNHHEKLDGSGYPAGLMEDELDFNSRLVACLDIYQALTETRPYRESMDHKKAMHILNAMGEDNKLDKKIIKDIDKVFEDYTKI